MTTFWERRTCRSFDARRAVTAGTGQFPHLLLGEPHPFGEHPGDRVQARLIGLVGGAEAPGEVLLFGDDVEFRAALVATPAPDVADLVVGDLAPNLAPAAQIRGLRLDNALTGDCDHRLLPGVRRVGEADEFLIPAQRPAQNLQERFGLLIGVLPHGGGARPMAAENSSTPSASF